MTWYMEFGGIQNKNFTRNLFMEINEREQENTEKMKKRFNNSDFYKANYIYDNIENIKESNIYGPLVIDLDSELEKEDDFENLKVDLTLVLNTLDLLMGIKENNLSIFFSGNKGFHIIVPPSIFGLRPSKNLNLIYKRIAEELYEISNFKTVDLKIYDKRRLIRMPNSINLKTGLYKVPIDVYKINNMSLEDLKEYAEEPKELKEIKDIKTKEKAIYYIKSLYEADKRKKEQVRKNNINYNKVFKDKKMPNVPCVKNIVDNGAIKGERNDTTVVLSSIILQGGFDLDETMAMVKYWNESKNEEPLGNREIETTVKSAYSMFLENKTFGCSTLSEISTCSPKCPIRNQ